MNKYDRMFISLVSSMIMLSILSVAAFIEQEDVIAFGFMILAMLSWFVSIFTPTNDE